MLGLLPRNLVQLRIPRGGAAHREVPRLEVQQAAPKLLRLEAGPRAENRLEMRRNRGKSRKKRPKSTKIHQKSMNIEGFRGVGARFRMVGGLIEVDTLGGTAREVQQGLGDLATTDGAVGTVSLWHLGPRRG